MSNAWHDIHWQGREKGHFNAVIEIPKNTKGQKIEMDIDNGFFRINKIMQNSMVYPANYGFIPQTLGEDKDPLDVVVITDDPVATGLYMECKPIGVINLKDDGEWDHKIIAIHHLDLISHHHSELLILERFFTDYKKYEKKKVEVKGIGSIKNANIIIQKSVERYNNYRYEQLNKPTMD